MKTLMIAAAVLVIGATGLSYLLNSAQTANSSSRVQSRQMRKVGFEVEGRVINAAGEAVVGKRIGSQQG